MNTSQKQLSLRFRLDLSSGRPGDDARLEPELMAALAANFSASVVPEPGTTVLACLGLGTLLLVGRRQRNR
jgi:hypothetical protein